MRAILVIALCMAIGRCAAQDIVVIEGGDTLRGKISATTPGVLWLIPMGAAQPTAIGMGLITNYTEGGVFKLPVREDLMKATNNQLENVGNDIIVGGVFILLSALASGTGGVMMAMGGQDMQKPGQYTIMAGGFLLLGATIPLISGGNGLRKIKLKR